MLRCSRHMEGMTVFFEECLLHPLVLKVSIAGSPEAKVSRLHRTLFFFFLLGNLFFFFHLFLLVGG